MNFVGTVIVFEPLPGVGVLGAGLAYLIGVRRLTAKGRKWQFTRSAAFAAGLVVLVVATQTGIAARDTESFTIHAIQHLLLSMLAPPLLCLGAPITLFLQSSARGSQRRLLRVLNSKPVKLLTFPVVSWMIFAGTLFVLYFSGFYDLSLRNEAFHDLVHAHFVASGFLFFSAVVSIDPHPWRMPHGLRMLYVGLTLPVHAFLALALISAATPLAVDWYMLTTGRSFEAILEDQKFGASIMWAAGDFIAILTVATVVGQWVKFDERSASREDKFVDTKS